MRWLVQVHLLALQFCNFWLVFLRQFLRSELPVFTQFHQVRFLFFLDLLQFFTAAWYLRTDWNLGLWFWRGGGVILWLRSWQRRVQRMYLGLQVLYFAILRFYFLLQFVYLPLQFNGRGRLSWLVWLFCREILLGQIELLWKQVLQRLLSKIIQNTSVRIVCEIELIFGLAGKLVQLLLSLEHSYAFQRLALADEFGCNWWTHVLLDAQVFGRAGPLELVIVCRKMHRTMGRCPIIWNHFELSLQQFVLMLDL